MRNINPYVTLLYYCIVVGITMCSTNPLILLISFSGAALYVQKQRRTGKAHAGGNRGLSIVFIVCIAAANFLFVHKGATQLIFLNGKALTMEAAVYGIVFGFMMLNMFKWLSAFNKDMTSECSLYVFGRISPGLALVISMILRFIPLYRRQASAIAASQLAIGMGPDESISSKVKCSLRSLSILTTWALENSIDTAYSMQARGYGLGHRSSYSDYQLHKRDVFMLTALAMAFIIMIPGISGGMLSCTFYPKITLEDCIPLRAGDLPGTVWNILLYVVFVAMVFVPVIFAGGQGRYKNEFTGS